MNIQRKLKLKSAKSAKTAVTASPAKAKAPKPPRATHRLYHRGVTPLLFLAGGVLSYALYAWLPKQVVTAQDREILAVMYAGGVAYVLVVASLVCARRGYKVMEDTEPGEVGGRKQFLTAFALFVAAAFAFIALRGRADTALTTWQFTLTAVGLGAVYLLFVKQTAPYAKDGTNLEVHTPVAGVAELEEIIGMPEGEEAYAVPEPPAQQQPQTPRQAVRLAWPLGQDGTVPDGAELVSPNGHAPTGWPQ